MKKLTKSLLAAVLLAASAEAAMADACVPLYTPKGSLITTAYQMSWELSSSDIAYLNNYVATRYPKAVRETNASRKYNCHSYAWYSQSTYNSIWIDNPGDDKYWLDKSYVYITGVSGGWVPSTVPNGAKVSYKSSDHSAIKASSTQFRSKWGTYPKMLHAPCYCPYSCSTLSYYQRNF